MSALAVLTLLASVPETSKVSARKERAAA
jgi:hypothetical protein